MKDGKSRSYLIWLVSSGWIVLNTIGQTGLVPIFYNSQFEVAKNIVRACAEGGATGNRIDQSRRPGAISLFTQLAEFCQKELPEVIFGVGSIVDAPTAAMYIASGREFCRRPDAEPGSGPAVQSPQNRLHARVRDSDRNLRRRGIGRGRCKNISRRTPLAGRSSSRRLIGPCPWTSIMATGGVEDTRECLETWFKSGITCVGMGGNLIQADRLAAGDYKSITDKVSKVIGWIAEIRQGMKGK